MEIVGAKKSTVQGNMDVNNIIYIASGVIRFMKNSNALAVIPSKEADGSNSFRTPITPTPETKYPPFTQQIWKPTPPQYHQGKRAGAVLFLQVKAFPPQSILANMETYNSGAASFLHMNETTDYSTSQVNTNQKLEKKCIRSYIT